MRVCADVPGFLIQGRSRSAVSCRSVGLEPGAPVTPQDEKRVNFASASPATTSSVTTPCARNPSKMREASSSFGLAVLKSPRANSAPASRISAMPR